MSHQTIYYFFFLLLSSFLDKFMTDLRTRFCFKVYFEYMHDR